MTDSILSIYERSGDSTLGTTLLRLARTAQVTNERELEAQLLERMAERRAAAGIFDVDAKGERRR